MPTPAAAAAAAASAASPFSATSAASAAYAASAASAASDAPATVAAASLDDKYKATQGRVFLTGVQALARLPMLQRERDRAAGLNTAGFVTGYRGSPLATLDATLHEAHEHLAAHDVRFVPAVNEDLGATSVWGTQQLPLFGPARRDGIFALWYGKGPGVDRCVDVFKHANHAGTSRHGGVLVVAGDDHAARSSAVAHQSEHVFSACGIPVLAPAGVQDLLDFGLAGWALSRYAGLWVALKLAADIVESAAVVTLPPAAGLRFAEPGDIALPAGGLHIRWPDPQLAQEHRMQAWKVYAALAWVRANGINRVVVDTPQARLGVMAGGKAFADLREAMRLLGLSDDQAAALGLRVMKIGMPWPLEAGAVREFAAGLEEILVVEEKRQIIEYQLKEMLYERRDGERPRVLGKFDEGGEWPAPHAPWLLPPTGELTPLVVARALASRLARIDPQGGWLARAAAREPSSPALCSNAPAATASAVGEAAPPALQRVPYFCPGCPHSRSTRVPEGSCALAGVGCHLMAVGMERRTLTISQMGGEGATWIGMAGVSEVRHVFANMGDGTYFHSGLLAIRAAVAAKVNITYKILYNDAVAMTGGQPVDGPLTVPRLTRQLAAEGVARIAVLADDPGKYARESGPDAGFAPGVVPQPRERLDAVQRELRAVPGTTVLVYDQVCATEARRRRKRGQMPMPERQVVIHEELCEGCGDCSVKSNCLAVVPVHTPEGTKRAIDPFTCNADLSCLEGECPALVTVQGATLRRDNGVATDEQGLPMPPRSTALDQPWSLLVAGVGGTGVVTIGALLGMAAHLDGLAATVLDQTGLAQKGGAVLSHVRFARNAAELHAPRIARADVLLGCDLLVAGTPETLARVVPGVTRAVVNTADAITGDIVRHPERAFPHERALGALRGCWGERASTGGNVAQGPVEFDASALAAALAGHSIAANMLLLGFAWQRGWVPVSRAAIARAIELNAVAVEDNSRAFAWGRRAAVDLPGVLAQALARRARDTSAQAAAAASAAADGDASLAAMLARRQAAVERTHGRRAAARYAALVERVRRAEQRAAPGSERLARAVARAAQRLYAPKDDYEAARLLTDPAFEARLRRRFEGPLRIHYHLTPPWRRGGAPADAAAGNGGAVRAAGKRVFGPWLRWPLRALAGLRALRGTWLDPLRTSAERSVDARLREAYEAAIERLLAQLQELAARPAADGGAGGDEGTATTPDAERSQWSQWSQWFDAAVALAELPEQARGFGSVKARRAAEVCERLASAGAAALGAPPAAARTGSSERVAA
ncbi:MAG: indolepyruvate ferredoxin oxidoreductase family protein [Rubrivivax sp.]|nr:indolepyruvate ferredoxin oxidoreductase family protein [Rubrivivax sp.]